jgi:hypothetical protein
MTRCFAERQRVAEDAASRGGKKRRLFHVAGKLSR